ncbi:wsv438 [White spot syndrome virus]|uniref:Wsv438 n=4 Tax=White spot syndrome virus TaxID=342409 RepID=Q8VAH6_WSSVS|nr:wsv438 [Shrimp white spot syndrome virus]AFX59815.1 wsv438 [White spot syndrome virus]AAL33439.1 wsv438 [Shrimp white spot syndrome virus]AAL89366.1 WSSV498 [Shrimp white spot syndrome virus]AWQ60562.1 wsv438 [Shrimp white spot syndrome virus]AWQ61004.1 wsv438 [Shrimp white spot syndrome virus]
MRFVPIQEVIKTCLPPYLHRWICTILGTRIQLILFHILVEITYVTNKRMDCGGILAEPLKNWPKKNWEEDV